MSEEKKPKAKTAKSGRPKRKYVPTGNPMGRPTTFRVEYIELFKELCKQGLSVPEIAAKIGVRRETLHDWAEKYPDFNHVYKIGNEYRQLWWANLGKQGMMGEKKVNLGFYIWLTKNLAGWQDKVVAVNQQDSKDPMNNLPEESIIEETERVLELIKKSKKPE